MRIIINVGIGTSCEEAVQYVSRVMQKGMVSEAGGIPHYCWLTVWENGIHVATNRKRTAKSADSFTVWVKNT